MATKVTGEIVVHSRTTLYEKQIGGSQTRFIHASATYKGDIDGSADETFLAYPRSDGSQVLIGVGTFDGNVRGRKGRLVWKFEGPHERGTIELVSGEGELSGATGRIPYAIKPGADSEFTYEGEID